MKVILETDIAGLGEEGSIIDVSRGYARNYLFPNRKAIQHNAQNMSVLRSRMKAIEHRRGERRKEHVNIKERLETETISIAMTTGEKGHLYGAVTTQIISDVLGTKGIRIPKSHIILPNGHSIKNIGVYSVAIKLYHGVQAQCRVIVTDEHGNTTTSKDPSITAKKGVDEIQSPPEQVVETPPAHRVEEAPAEEHTDVEHPPVESVRMEETDK